MGLFAEPFLVLTTYLYKLQYFLEDLKFEQVLKVSFHLSMHL